MDVLISIGAHMVAFAPHVEHLPFSYADHTPSSLYMRRISNKSLRLVELYKSFKQTHPTIELSLRCYSSRRLSITCAKISLGIMEKLIIADVTCVVALRMQLSALQIR
ncbi:hypothetical protein GOP47_0027140 [Adiantum capillus-veneris]|nr:hypothetical protein GOP47_0027140 [Adiantum capillus-veneris]